MSRRKIYYRYNSATDKYDRVFISRSQRVLGLLRNIFEVAFVVFALGALLYYCVDLPRERLLRLENEELKDELREVDGRLNRALQVLDEIRQRDNSFYRVMLQADPIPLSGRIAGHDAVAEGNLSDQALIRSVDLKIDLLERMLHSQSKSFDELRLLAADSKERLMCVPSVQPISEKDMKQMASGYGWRVDPVYGTKKFHEGMDFASATGTPVYATGNGTVTVAGWQSAYGNAIDIDHGYNYTTRFAHLSEVLVKPGQRVKRGDLIGKVGNTGKSTGPHLHYEVRYKNEPRNPVNYYFQDLTPEEYAEMVRQAEAAANVMD